MVIRTNVAALRTYREGVKNARAMAKNLEKLSSGYRINRSADDASGLAVSERMRANITELGRCYSNAMEGLDIAKTADGALAEINDMLRRARGLCIQAENGTYSEQELASISDEINQLFSEVDRITASSTFNEIRLFRGDLGPDFHYEYDETFTPVEGVISEKWGDLDFVSSKEFDPASDPVQAKVTFQLDDSIDFNDLSSLYGKAISVGGRNYYFYRDYNTVPSGYTGIPVNGSVEATLRKLGSSSYGGGSYLNSVIVDQNARTVTFSASILTRPETVHANGETITYRNPIDGTHANGTTVSNPSGSESIKPVDGVDATDNRLIWSNATNETSPYWFNSIGDGGITAAQLENLNRNWLVVGNHSNIYFKNLNIQVGDSRKTIGDKIVAEINKDTNYIANYDDNVGLTVVRKLSSQMSSGTSIYEGVGDKQSYKPPSNPGHAAWDEDVPDSTNSWHSNPLTFNIERSAPGLEKKATVTVTIPSIGSDPVSFAVGSRRYLIYDGTKNKTVIPGYDGTTMSPSYNVSMFDVSGGGDVNTFLANAIRSACPSGYTASQEGNKIVFTAENSTVPLREPNLSGATVTFTPYHTKHHDKIDPSNDGQERIPGEHALGTGYSYLRQPGPEVPFSLGATLDKDRLSGSGFTIGSQKFEFVNGGSGLNAGYKDIDISTCNNFEDLLAKVKASLPSGWGWDAKLDDIGTDDVKLKITVDSSYGVTDGLLGVDGLMQGGPVQYSGGVDAEHSQTTIDFSSVNSSNLNDLLGKGFRINCATCDAEYVNIFFCWKKGADMPESFEIKDSEGNPRTILNIPVELSQVTSGDRIVESIVNQLESKLNHYTGLRVGTPPTTLIAYEKRQGDVTDPGDPNGKVYLGSVDSGVDTNFTYSVNIRKVEDYPDDGSVVAKDNIVEIYVGSEPGPQIIPIHLPYLDLKTLRLSPPEVVDLNAMDQDAAEWLNRVDQANLYISKSRGVIGADHNRLEHAAQSLSHSKENLTDAESRIRDTDMAEEMMEHVKLQILTQAQQGMLAQACSQPQQVLKLIS